MRTRVPLLNHGFNHESAERVRVLIAEDDQAVRGLLCELIRGDPGLELVGTAVDTTTAIAIAAMEHPDVALVDVRMPGGGGALAARGIRDVSAETKVIAFSGAADASAVTAELFAAGVIQYLVKGGPIDAILDSIHTAAIRA